MYHVNVNVSLIVKNATRIKSIKPINVDASAKIQTNIVCKKVYTLNPATCTCENDRHTENIIGNLVITCDEIIEETVPTKSTSTRAILTKTTSRKDSSKKYFNRFLYFTNFFIHYHSVIDNY